MKDLKSIQDARKQHNEQLIRRMKSGEQLWSYDSKASWFPPRPIIEKDPEAIKKLYKTNSTDAASIMKDSTVKHIENRLKIVQKIDENSETGKTGS